MALSPTSTPIESRFTGGSRRNMDWLPLIPGVAMIAILVVFILLGRLAANHSAAQTGIGPRLNPPGEVFWFGTDHLGRDVFSRTVEGIAISLFISLAATCFSAGVGLLCGGLAGFRRGRVDLLLTRTVDILLSLPGILIALVLIARLGADLWTLILSLSISGVPVFFRVCRAEAAGMACKPFIQASRALGMSQPQIFWRHILPNLAPSMWVLASMRVGIFLLMASGLSFIGLGVQPPLAEIGAMLADGREYINAAWWMAVFPGLAVLWAALGFNLLGEALRDAWLK